MKFSDDTLMAYADGELDAETSAAVQQALASDPQLAAKVASHRKLRTTLRVAFSDVVAEPVPERLIAATNQTPATTPVVNLAAVRTARLQNDKRRWSWPEWMSVAASLTIGILLGRTLLQSPEGARVARGDGITADATLAAALSQQSSGVRSTSAKIDIGMSFRAKSGEYCRTFVILDGDGLAGLACKQADEWRIQALARGNIGGANERYRMAASPVPLAILQAVEDSISGEALDAEQEALARQRNWLP